MSEHRTVEFGSVNVMSDAGRKTITLQFDDFMYNSEHITWLLTNVRPAARSRSNACARQEDADRHRPGIEYECDATVDEASKRALSI
jgi:hypothetical protein